jgi:hypothetical protein
MRDRFSPPGPILFAVRLLLTGLVTLLAIQAYGWHVRAVPQLQETGLRLQGRIRNWQLGEGYFVVVAIPEVKNRVQAVFPESFDSAGIGTDGSFVLLLSHEPRWLTAEGSALQALCPAGSAKAATSFHYLTVTQKPVPGALFNDFGLIRPITDDPELLVFFTFLGGPDGEAGAADSCQISAGWNMVNVRQSGEGTAEAQVMEARELEWQLVR